MWELDYKELSTKELMLLNCGVGEDSWESLGLQGDPTSPSWKRSVLNIHWKDWCWSWNSNTLATWSEELTHLKRPWCWERLKAGGEGDDRGWDDWMASPTQWTWVWVNSGSWWWTGRPGVLQFMGSQRVRHDWATELNWSLYTYYVLGSPKVKYKLNNYFLTLLSFLSYKNSGVHFLFTLISIRLRAGHTQLIMSRKAHLHNHPVTNYSINIWRQVFS